MQRWGNLCFGLKTKVVLAITSASFLLGLIGFWVNHTLHQVYMPKPMGYCRINLPTQCYQLLQGDFPYMFEHSIHANVQPSQSSYKVNYWIDLYYPAFDATIYISYQSVAQDPALLKALCENASILAFKHQAKASYIEESVIQTPKGYRANVIELFGEVPTPFQFYTTDGQKHFLRGALYFKTALQNDFLEPVIQYLKKDILHMLHTLEWKK